ncbi:MAG TPA: hypothetical protein DCE14_08640 [Kosmotogaceae bacterium]|nr:hypothetical protein [Kosmotogaceae bacterium]
MRTILVLLTLTLFSITALGLSALPHALSAYGITSVYYPQVSISQLYSMSSYMDIHPIAGKVLGPSHRLYWGHSTDWISKNWASMAKSGNLSNFDVTSTKKLTKLVWAKHIIDDASTPMGLSKTSLVKAKMIVASEHLLRCLPVLLLSNLIVFSASLTFSLIDGMPLSEALITGGKDMLPVLIPQAAFLAVSPLLSKLGLITLSSLPKLLGPIGLVGFGVFHVYQAFSNNVSVWKIFRSPITYLPAAGLLLVANPGVGAIVLAGIAAYSLIDWLLSRSEQKEKITYLSDSILETVHQQAVNSVLGAAF